MRKLLLAGLIGAAMLWSCEPKPRPEELIRNLAVYTDREDFNTDYSKYSTYYLRLDTINYYSYGYDTLQVTAPNSLDLIDYVTTTVNDSLKKRGFVPVTRKSSPDLKVMIYIIENYSVSYSYYPYNYGYGYGYGYGGGYTTANVSDQANLYIQILDVKHLTNAKPTLVWYCNIGDIASLSSDEAFINALITAFQQSWYLRK